MRFTVLLPTFFFLASHLQGRNNGHPVYGSELADFKALLERLEDKLEPGAGDAVLERDFNEPDSELTGEALPADAPWDVEYPRPPSEGVFRRSDRWSSARVSPAARNRLGAFLSTPRRVSSCFGQRLDRIGSSSGLGCKRSRGWQEEYGFSDFLDCQRHPSQFAEFPSTHLRDGLGLESFEELNLSPTTAKTCTRSTCCAFPGTA